MRVTFHTNVESWLIKHDDTLYERTRDNDTGRVHWFYAHGAWAYGVEPEVEEELEREWEANDGI